jgi:hypothetical protein
MQQRDAPIFQVRASGKRMTDYHHIIPLLVQLPPRLVRNGDVPQDLSTFEGEGREDENILVNLKKLRHRSRPGLPSRVNGNKADREKRKVKDGTVEAGIVGEGISKASGTLTTGTVGGEVKGV